MAFDLILQLKMKEAEERLEMEKNSNPGNDVIHYLESYSEFLELIITEESRAYSQFKDHAQIRLEKLRRGDKDSPYHLYLRAEIHLQIALLNMKFNDPLKALFHFYSSFRLVQENKEMYPQFNLNLKLSGIQNVMLGAVPDNYSWVMKISGMSGDSELGIRELEKYHKFTTESAFPELEAVMILAHMYIQFDDQDERALAFLCSAGDLPYENPLFRFTYALSLNKAGKNYEITPLLENHKQAQDEVPFYFLDFLLGESKLNMLEEDAVIYLENFINRFEGMHYIKSAWLKLGWYYFLQGNDAKFRECFEKVRSSGSKFFEADKLAFDEASGEREINPMLLKARLLFDGGSYQEARQTLPDNHISDFFPSLGEKLEYFYRMARISHKLNDTEAAEKYYILVVKYGRRVPVYYASHSALQLGKIHEIKGESEKAESYYLLCLELNRWQYQTSIERKTRNALEQLRPKNKL